MWDIVPMSCYYTIDTSTVLPSLKIKVIFLFRNTFTTSTVVYQSSSSNSVMIGSCWESFYMKQRIYVLFANRSSRLFFSLSSFFRIPSYRIL